MSVSEYTMNRLVLYFRLCAYISAPAIVNVIILYGTDSVVDNYTLLEPTKSLESTVAFRVTSNRTVTDQSEN